MIKKVFKVFTFFALLQVLVYSCCEDAYNVYYEQILFTATDTSDFDASSVAPDNLALIFNFEYKYIQIAALLDLDDFVTDAYATTCDEDYFFKDTITDISVTANETIFDIESGNSLNNVLQFINPDTLESQSMNDLVSYLNENASGYYYQDLTLIFNDSLPNDLSIAFHIQINLEGGRSLENTTELITIE